MHDKYFFSFLTFCCHSIKYEEDEYEKCSVNFVSVINRNKFMQKSEHLKVTMGHRHKFLFLQSNSLILIFVFELFLYWFFNKERRRQEIWNIYIKLLFCHKIYEFTSLCYKYLKRNWHFKVWFEHISNYKSCFIFIAIYALQYTNKV